MDSCSNEAVVIRAGAAAVVVVSGGGSDSHWCAVSIFTLFLLLLVL